MIKSEPGMPAVLRRARDLNLSAADLMQLDPDFLVVADGAANSAAARQNSSGVEKLSEECAPTISTVKAGPPWPSSNLV